MAGEERFVADIERWAKKTRLSGGVVMRKLGLDAFRGVLLRSPVDTGRFRASNRISVNRVDRRVEPKRGRGTKEFNAESGGAVVYGTSPSGEEMGRAISVLAEVTWTDSIHISNNLPYAEPLEDGHSAQNGNQPGGIYQATFSELQANLQAAIRAARRVHI